MSTLSIIILIIVALFAYGLYIEVRNCLTKNCVDIVETPLYKVGITIYKTEFGAKARCQYLYKKYGVDAEVTIIYPFETVKENAVTLWNLTK